MQFCKYKLSILNNFLGNLIVCPTKFTNRRRSKGFTQLNRNSRLTTGNLTGFTFIELGIVVVIIGIVATISIIAFNSVSAKNRDTKRIGDIRSIQTALELYYNRNNGYPATLTPGLPLSNGGKVYLDKVPSAPGHPDGTCTTDAYTYTLIGNSYTLDYCLGGSVQNIGPGKFTAMPGQIGVQSLATNLTNLTFSETVANYAFSAVTYAYNGLTVANAVSSVSITPTGVGTITVDGTPVTSGQASNAITLNLGEEKTINVVVTEDGTLPKAYALKVTRQDAQATPTFSPIAGAITFGSTVEITSDGADAIYVTSNGSDPTTASTLYTGPLTVSVPLTFKALAVKAGKVDSAIGSATYTQAPASDLINLAIDNSPANYTFSGGTYTYDNVTVLNAAAGVILTPTGPPGVGLIYVNDNPIVSGNNSQYIALTVGVQRTISVVVTETNKADKVYLINITRQPPPPATKLVITAINGVSGVTVITATNFTLTVEARDDTDTPASPLNNTTVTLSENGAGSLIVVSGNTISTSQTSATITVKYTYASAGEWQKMLTPGDQAGVITNVTGMNFNLRAPQPSPVSYPSFSSITSTSIAVSWTNGNGVGRFLVVKQGSTAVDELVDGNLYTTITGSPQNFTSGGNVLGSSKIMYGGTGVNGPVTITGLTPGTTYNFKVFEYKMATGDTGGTTINYASSGTFNPRTQATLP